MMTYTMRGKYPVCHLLDKNINLNTPYFWSIARQHDRERYPVMFCTLEPAGPVPQPLSEQETRQFSVGVTARWQYPLAILRLAGLLRRQRVSILHAHFFDPTLVGLIAARLAGARFVFTRHHSDHNSRLGKRWHTRIDAWCGRYADHVIAVSEATRRIMVEGEGVPAELITTVYNGMNPLQRPQPESVVKLRRELGIDQEFVLVVLARLHEEKGHRYLFDALPEIISQVGPVTVLVCGEGTYRAELEAEVSERGLRDVVRFLGRRRDVPELISLASLLVLPSLAESFGFALVEAMSLGKPVVATTAGGIPEVVADGETGVLVPLADSKALASAICRLLETPALMGAMGEAGRSRSEFFSFERMIRGYEAIYDTVLEDSQEKVTSSAASPANNRGSDLKKYAADIGRHTDV